MDNEIEVVKNSFEKLILPNIENALSGGAPLAAFMFTLSAIDCVGGFYCGKKSTKGTFTSFMKDFQSLKIYDAEIIYEHLRSGLMHQLTIKKDAYLLTHLKPHLHLKKSDDGCIIINFENFFSDFKKGLDDYFSQLEKGQKSKKLQYNLVKRYHVWGKIMSLREVADESNPAAPCVFLSGAFTNTVSKIPGQIEGNGS